MDYAVIQAGGKQYRVQKGERLVLDKLEHQSSEQVVFDQVLLVVSDGQTLIGTPFVPNAKVVALVKGDQRGPKIRVAKFRAKSNYRRVQGHRQEQTVVEVTDITADGLRAKVKEAAALIDKKPRRTPTKQSSQKLTA